MAPFRFESTFLKKKVNKNIGIELETIFSPDHITQILLCGIKSMCSHHLE